MFALALLAVGTAHAQTLVISPNPVNLFAQSGGSPVQQSLTFNSSDNNATSIPFNVIPGNSWITVSAAPSAGWKTPATVVVSVNPATLPTGVNTGSLSIYSTQFQIVQVNVTVSSISVILPNNQTNTLSLGSYQAGSTVNLSPQLLTVVGANGNFTVSKAPADTWYTAAAYGNPLSGVEVQVNSAVASSLTPGTLTGTLTITPGGSNAVPVTIPVTLAVTASPQVTVNPASLTFNWQQFASSNQNQQIITLTSNATQPLPLSVSAPGIPWITLPSSNPTTIPAGGTAQVAIQVNGNNQALGANSGSVQLTVSGALFPNGSSSLNVPVTLNISTYPLLYSTPSSLTYSYQFGSLSTPASQAVTPTSSGAPGQQLEYTVSTTPAGTWLSTAPNGTLTTGGGSFTVYANPTGLSPGVYTGTVTITPAANGSGQGPITIPVTLTITFSNVLQVSTNQLVFPYEIGQSTPAPQTVTLSSSTGAPLNYTITPPSSATAPWVQVTSSGGQTNGTITGVTDQTSFTVSINTSGVPSPPPSTFLDATINIAATDPTTGNAVNSQSIDVRLYASTTPQLVVTPPGPLLFSTYPNSPRYPEDDQGPLALTLSSTSPAPGDALNITQIQRIVNNAASTGNWLGGTNPGGTTSTSFTVTATQLSATNMPAGTYNGQVTISATGSSANLVADSPVTIPAIFVVNTAKGSISTPAGDGTLSFLQTKGGQDPAALTVQVNTDTGGLPFDAVVNTGLLSWLTVSTPTGPTPGSFRVNADATNLTTGVYKGAIYVTIPNAQGSPFRIPVTFTVNGGSIASSASSLSFTQIIGAAAPAAQTVQITSSPSTVTYSTSVTVNSPANGAWLSASITTGGGSTSGTGTTPGTVTVSVTPGSLTAGIYQGTVTITSAGTSGSPITIPVTLTVQQATISAPTAALSFTQLAGGPAPAAQSVPVTATPSAIGYSVATTTSNGIGWLTATAGTSGTSGTTPGNVQISVNSGTLTPGPYTGLVTITSPGAIGSPISIPVLLTVSSAAVLTVSQPTLTFAAVVGQATTPQTVTLNSSSATPFTITTSTKDGATWLTAAPSSGNAGSSPITLTISANTQNLAAGSYSGTVTISSVNSIAPVTIAVSLTVQTIPTPVLVAVKNAASYVAGAVSPGENIVIGGTGVGPATLAGAQLTSGGQLSTLVGNTQVLFDGTPAPIIYASSTQTSVMVPYEIAGRSVTNIQIVYSGVPSVALPYNVVAAVPGIYTQNLAGSGPGVILNQDGITVNGPNTPAAKGSVVTIYMTGEGSTTPASTTGSVADTPGNGLNKPLLAVTATVGGLPATVNYAGSAPLIVYGVMQVDVTIPATVASGAQSLVINVGNNATQAAVTVAVQ
jgi:uncharacterized protein (TIGR03437 family)